MIPPPDDREDLFLENDLVKLTVYGVAVTDDNQRPSLVLKDDNQDLTLLVPVNPIEAGIVLSQENNTGLPSTPHRFVGEFFKQSGGQAVRCVFVELKEPHQYVRIYLNGVPGVSSIRLRADEAMSLCLHLKLPIFASRQFIQRCRHLKAEIDVAGRVMQQIPQISQRNHPYLM